MGEINKINKFEVGQEYYLTTYNEIARVRQCIYQKGYSRLW